MASEPSRSSDVGKRTSAVSKPVIVLIAASRYRAARREIGAGGSRLGRDGPPAHLDAPAAHAHVERGLRVRRRSLLDGAVLEPEPAAVPRAGHAAVGDLAPAERAAAVRAAVREDADLAAVAHHQ